MKIVMLSDTHARHAGLKVPEGDLLIHAGDFSSRGRLPEVVEFLHWFAALPHPHKVLIAGNHDFLAEQNPGLFKSLIPEGIHYLNDSACTIEGIQIWGSPVQPWFHNWAFNRQRGSEIRRHWDMIPEGTDILIVHGPPFGIGDLTVSGEQVGCKDLLERILAIRPKLCVFGHIHEAHGAWLQEGTLFANVSVLDFNYKLSKDPQVIFWEDLLENRLII